MESDTAVCERIINAQSPFECFELPVQAVEPGVVRNIYLKIAIRVHPDKNSSPHATEAFQILSEAFEELHDEEKQANFLNQASHQHKQQQSHRKRRKRKQKDISDLVHQNDKWWTKDWNEVEEEISRMTTEFKEHLARKQLKDEIQKEKKAKLKEKKRKKLKKNLSFLYEKYGINPSDSDSDSDRNLNTYNYVSYVSDPTQDPQEYAQQQVQQHASEHVQERASEHVQEVPSSSSSVVEAVCWVCRRSFKSKQMLQIHNEKSELHKTNVAKAQKPPENKFKNSFYAVKDC